jgi:thioesterase domain-containing protein
MTVTVTDAARRYHHPNFRCATTVDTDNGPALVFTFAQFSPWGREPEMPSYWEDQALTRQDQEFLSQEWEAARTEHWKCVFREDVRRQLGDAGGCRNAYLAAREAMDGAYAAFATAGDGQWRALLLAMATAHGAAMTTAKAWNEAASGLARAQRNHWQHVGRDAGLTLAAVAAESGYGISEWGIQEIGADEDPYQGSYPPYDGPAVAEVRPLVEQQRLLKAAGEMAGDRS